MTLILCKYDEHAYTFAQRLIVEIVCRKQRTVPYREAGTLNLKCNAYESGFRNKRET
jgi:hypothetical protein